VHIGLEGPHAPGAVFANHEFQVIAPWRQQEAGVVLHVLTPDLLCAVHGQLDGVPQLAHRELAILQHYADYIERCVVLVFLLHKWNL
jgi:hypothetical protein